MTRRLPTTVEPEMVSSKPAASVDLLILGAGWTSTFLVPLLKSQSIAFAATSTTGRDDTIRFRFDPATSDVDSFSVLPTARTVLITFPLTGPSQSKKLVELYTSSRSSETSIRSAARLFLQLGSTGIFTAPHWNTHKSPYDKDNARAQAEDELLSLSGSHSSSTAVLNLAGLYGGQRDPKAWLPRVIRSKSDIKGKKALHLVHGEDVARAILSCHGHPIAVAGQRWIITDLHVYDWWDLIFEWSGLQFGKESMDLVLGDQVAQDRILIRNEGPQTEKVLLKKAILEYMESENVRALPRSAESLGRILDARDFWKAVGSWPSVGRVR